MVMTVFAKKGRVSTWHDRKWTESIKMLLTIWIRSKEIAYFFHNAIDKWMVMNFIAKNRPEVFAPRRNKHPESNIRSGISYLFQIFRSVIFEILSSFYHFWTKIKLKSKEWTFTKQIFCGQFGRFEIACNKKSCWFQSELSLSGITSTHNHIVYSEVVYHLIIKSVLIQYTRANGNYLNMSIFTSKQLATILDFFFAVKIKFSLMNEHRARPVK